MSGIKVINKLMFWGARHSPATTLILRFLENNFLITYGYSLLEFSFDYSEAKSVNKRVFLWHEYECELSSCEWDWVSLTRWQLLCINYVVLTLLHDHSTDVGRGGVRAPLNLNFWDLNAQLCMTQTRWVSCFACEQGAHPPPRVTLPLTVALYTEPSLINKKSS